MLAGLQLFHKSKGVTCFSRRRFPSKPARFLVQLRLLRPPVWAARSPLNSNHLHLSPPPTIQRALFLPLCLPGLVPFPFRFLFFLCWAFTLSKSKCNFTLGCFDASQHQWVESVNQASKVAILMQQRRHCPLCWRFLLTWLQRKKGSLLKHVDIEVDCITVSKTGRPLC